MVFPPRSTPSSTLRGVTSSHTKENVLHLSWPLFTMVEHLHAASYWWSEAKPSKKIYALKIIWGFFTASRELDYFRLLQGFAGTAEILLAPVRPRAIPMGKAEIWPHVLAEGAELKKHPVPSQSQDRHKHWGQRFSFISPQTRAAFTPSRQIKSLES